MDRSGTASRLTIRSAVRSAILTVLALSGALSAYNRIEAAGAAV